MHTEVAAVQNSASLKSGVWSTVSNTTGGGGEGEEDELSHKETGLLPECKLASLRLRFLKPEN